MKFSAKCKPELCASKDETRPHINRVELDVANKKMVATDGHRMVVIPVETDDHDTSGPISSAALDAARKHAKKTGGDAEIKSNGALVVAGATFDRDKNAMAFPPWKMVVPKRAPITIRLNAKYLLEIAKAIGSKDDLVALAITGDLDPILVYANNGATNERYLDGENDAFGVLMPCRK